MKLKVMRYDLKVIFCTFIYILLLNPSNILSSSLESFDRFIKFKIEIVNISENGTDVLATNDLYALDNHKSEVSYNYFWGKSKKKQSMQVQLTPRILRMGKIKINMFILAHVGDDLIPGGAGRWFLLRDKQSFLMILWVNDKEKQKIGVRITAFIQPEDQLMAYPFEKIKLIIRNWMMILNNKTVYRGGTLELPFADEDPYLYIYLKDKGLYLIGFKEFNGSEPSGMLESNKITIKHGQDIIEWISVDPIVSKVGKWRLWVAHTTDFKAETNSYTRNFSTDKTERDKEIIVRAGIISQKDAWKIFFRKDNGDN